MLGNSWVIFALKT